MANIARCSAPTLGCAATMSACTLRRADAYREHDTSLAGGVSMGDKDFVKPLLESRGTVHFGKVRPAS